MSDRSCLNKLFYVIYRLIAILYNTVIHYYIPFVATFILSAYMAFKRLQMQKAE